MHMDFNSVNTTGNRVNISAKEFCLKVGQQLAKANHLSDALITMSQSFIENVNTWEKDLFEGIALEMAGPMNRVHRWRRHRGIIQIRQVTSKVINKRGAPWWKCWKWRYINVSYRQLRRAEMLAELRADARTSTSELARVYVDTIADGSDSKFGKRGFRGSYEHGWFNSSIPEEVSLDAFNFVEKIEQPSMLRSDVQCDPDLTCDYALSVLQGIKETYDAARVWQVDAMLDVPVAFVNMVKSMDTLVHQPLINTMKALCARSMDRLNMPLPIPTGVRHKLKISAA